MSLPKKKIEHNKPKIKKILEMNRSEGLLIPIDWKYPYLFKKKDYLSIIIGMNPRYEFERVFLDKKDFVNEESEEKVVGIGFEPFIFKDGLILEEKFSYKQDNSLISKTNYWKISIIDDDIYGESISKSEIKVQLVEKQQNLLDNIRTLFNQFGEEFCIYTMKSILKQRESVMRKMEFNKSFSFL